MATRSLVIPGKVRNVARGGTGVAALAARSLVRADSTNNLPAGIVGAEGEVLRGIGSSWGLLPGAKIVQVVYAHAAAQFSLAPNTSLNTWLDIGLSASITPSSPLSKILILAAVSGGIAVPSGNQMSFVDFGIVRNTTPINYFGYGSGYISIANGTHYGCGWGTSDVVDLDAPNTTNPVTYKARVIKYHAHGTLYLHWGGYGSSLVLLEVAA
jgi:hypothetical protein